MQYVDDGSVLLRVDSMALDNAAAASGFVGTFAPHAIATSRDVAANTRTACRPKRPAGRVQSDAATASLRNIHQPDRSPIDPLMRHQPERRPGAGSVQKTTAAAVRVVCGFRAGVVGGRHLAPTPDWPQGTEGSVPEDYPR